MSVRGIITAIAAIAIVLPLVGCPAPCVDDQTAKQNAAMGSQAMLVLLKAAGSTVTESLSGAQLDEAKQDVFNVPYSEIIDFDAVDGEGNDRYPGVSGQMQASGVAALTRTPYGFMFQSMPITLATLTEVEIAFPALEARVKIPSHSSFAFIAVGEYSLTDGGPDGDDPLVFDAHVRFMDLTQWNSPNELPPFGGGAPFRKSYVEVYLLRAGQDPVDARIELVGTIELGCRDDDIYAGGPAQAYYNLDQKILVSWRNGPFSPFVAAGVEIAANSGGDPPIAPLQYSLPNGESGVIALDDFIQQAGLSPLPPLDTSCPSFVLNPQAGLEVTALAAKAIVLVETLSFEALMQDVQGWAAEDRAKSVHIFDRTLDFDSLDGEGNDRFPNATGVFRIVGTVQLVDDPQLGGSELLPASKLTATVLQDIVLTSPEGSAITLPTWSSLTFYAGGEIIPAPAFTADMTLEKDVRACPVKWTLATGSGSSTVDAEGEIGFTYEDANPLDLEPGRTLSGVLEETFELSTMVQGKTHTVGFSVDGTMNAEAVAASTYFTVDGKTYGPFGESQPTQGLALGLLVMSGLAPLF